MLYRLAADLVLMIHFVFVSFALFGGFGTLMNSRWIWVHLPVVLWSSIVNLAGWTCPLTPLEKRLRTASGNTGYEGGFIEHYIGPLIYPKGMPRRLEFVAGFSVFLWNILVYFLIWWWVQVHPTTN